MTPILEGKSIGSDQKTMLKGELLIWRTNNEAMDQGIWSNSRIQFASNQSKLVPRKLDPGSSCKVDWTLRYASLGHFMEHCVLCKKGCNELAIKGKAIITTAMLQLVEILTTLVAMFRIVALSIWFFLFVLFPFCSTEFIS
jgi:hypothetical protein